MGELLTGVMLVYHDFRGDVASQIGTHTCAEVNTATLRAQPGPSCCRARMRAGSSSGARECQSKYQRLDKALVRTLTRFVVRRALVAPLRLASRLALHRHRLTIMRARSGESTIGCSHCAGCRYIYR